jgi:hypothetical protein
MQVDPFPYDEDHKAPSDVSTPGNDRGDDLPGPSERRPRVEFFARRPFLSKDTGRWHQHPGGRNRLDEELVTTAKPEDHG